MQHDLKLLEKARRSDQTRRRYVLVPTPRVHSQTCVDGTHVALLQSPVIFWRCSLWKKFAIEVKPVASGKSFLVRRFSTVP